MTKIKVTVKRSGSSGKRNWLETPDGVFYSMWGSEAWGKDEDGKQRYGKLIPHEEYDIEYETNKKGYNTIKKIERLTFKAKGEIEAPEQEEPRQEGKTTTKTTTELTTGKASKPIRYELSLPKPTTSELIVRPQVSVEDALAYWEEYNKLKIKLLQPSDYIYYVEHGNDKPKGFKTNKEADVHNEKMYKGKGSVIGRIKKSGWRKLANAFNLSVQKISEVIIPEPPRETQYAKIEVLVIAPNGRTMPGEGVCSAHERGFAKQDHDIPATAMTRAVNRGISDLIAAGEVSAEEIVAAHSGKKEEPKKYESVTTPSGQKVLDPKEKKPANIEEGVIVEEKEKAEVVKTVKPLTRAEEEKPPKLTATTQCSEEQKKEIRGMIKETAKTYEIKIKELSKEVQQKFGFETLDQVSPEKADEIIKYLKGGE